MRVEYTEVSNTQKALAVEIPEDVVSQEIERVTKNYARSLRLPGFRPGKIPPKVVRHRFLQQILQDVAQDLIPRAVDDALRERGVEPIETPSVRDVSIDEGQPLRFTAAFEIAPPVEPGPLDAISLRRGAVSVTDEQVEQTLERLRSGHARFEPVEDRGAETGDTVVMDMSRRKLADGARPPDEPAMTTSPSGIVLTDPPSSSAGIVLTDVPTPPPDTAEEPAESLSDVPVELGNPVNPPGFDDEIRGLKAGDTRTFRVSFPPDYPVEAMSGANVEYAVSLKQVRKKVLPTLDDEFAKDLGHESLEELRNRVRERLAAEATRTRDREIRQDLLRQLASRVSFAPPESLVTREVDRRLEDFVQQLASQGVDPRQVNVDWEGFRRNQREAAEETVKCALVLDEIARREQLKVDDMAVDEEIGRYAERTGQPADKLRAHLEREGAISRIYTGLRREKAIDYALSHATMVKT